MNGFDMVSMSALMLAGILLTLVLQSLKLQQIGHMIGNGKAAARLLSVCRQENGELRLALRAEKAHAEQLQRQLEQLQPLVASGLR